MKVRLAKAEDAPAISDLIRPLAEKYITHEFSAEGTTNLLNSMTVEAIEGFLKAGLRYHIAESDGELVGVVATRDNQHLFSLFVAEGFQRQGIARRLWEVAKQACLDVGGATTFTVNSSRFAVGVYKRFGFVETSSPVEQNGVVFVPMKCVPCVDTLRTEPLAAEPVIDNCGGCKIKVDAPE